MESVIKILLQLSIAMTFVSGIVIVFLPLVRRYFKPKGIYYSLLILLFGFLIPYRPMPGAPMVEVPVPPPSAISVSPGLRPGLQHMDGANAASRGISVTTAQLLFLIWIAGMLAILIYHITKHMRFLKIVKRWRQTLADDKILEILEQEKRKLEIRKEIGLFRCVPVNIPTLTGILKPTVLLPNLNLDEQEYRLIFRHELIHYKRRDLWGKLLMMTVLTVHWFNPLVYILIRITAAYCEEACDGEVVKNCSLDMRQYYSETIIRAIRRGANQKTMFSTSFYGGKSNMKKRILSIMNMKNKRFGTVVISCVLILTLSAGTFFAFGTSKVQADTEGKSENYHIVAELSALERNISVSDYNRKLTEVCEENGRDFFVLMSEVSEEIGPDDPLYSFYEDTLAFSSSELFADIMGGEENSFAYVYSAKEEYGSEPVREDSYTDTEWNLIQERGPELVYMVSVNYVLNYNISDTNSLTIEERDSLIIEAREEIQAYLAGLSEEELMKPGIKARLTEEVNRTCQKYSGKQMTLNGEIQNIERLGRDGEVLTE